MSETQKGINPALRNFFFFGLKSRKEFKQAQKEIGKIETVSIIITDKRTVLKAESETDFRDTEFTPEEKQKLLKILNIKQETVDACKSIFAVMDMTAKTIHIRENKKDGTHKDMNI